MLWMNKVIILNTKIFFLFLFLNSVLFGQAEYIDIVKLKNKTILKGKISYLKNNCIKLVSRDNSIYFLSNDNIISIKKKKTNIITKTDLVRRMNNEYLTTETENYYLYFGIGYSAIFRSKFHDKIIDDFKDIYGARNSSLSIDMFGNYWHYNYDTLIGFIINGSADRYNYGEESFQINYYNYSLSSIKFINEFGSGLIVRGDLGFSVMALDYSDKSIKYSSLGYSALIGSGYAFDLGGNRLLLNINYSFMSIDKNNTKFLQISLGTLF